MSNDELKERAYVEGKKGYYWHAVDYYCKVDNTANKDEIDDRNYYKAKKNRYWNATDDHCGKVYDSNICDRYCCESNCNKCHTCCTGARGAKGARGVTGVTETTGPTGVTGATGAMGAIGEDGFITQLKGIQVQLQDQEIFALDAGKPVIFDTIINELSPFISYNNITGEITISQTGVFYINWWVAINGLGGGSDTVSTLAITTSACDNIQASTFTQKGKISGNALISVNASPVISQLVNATDYTIDFGLTPIRANLRIVNVTL